MAKCTDFKPKFGYFFMSNFKKILVLCAVMWYNIYGGVLKCIYG